MICTGEIIHQDGDGWLLSPYSPILRNIDFVPSPLPLWQLHCRLTCHESSLPTRGHLGVVPMIFGKFGEFPKIVSLVETRHQAVGRS